MSRFPAFVLLPLLLAAQEKLTNKDIVKMLKAGMSEEIVIGAIQQGQSSFDTSPDALIALKSEGASDKIIAAVLTKKGSPSPHADAPTSVPAELLLRDSTPIRLRLSRNVSSADAKVGDTVDFEVLEDVKVDEILVIPRGGTAIATVTTAQAKRRMGRGGKLDINIDFVRLTNNEKVALRAVKETKGGGHTGAMTGGMVATAIVFFPAAPLFLFMHGKDITIPKGTEITAYVNGDVRLDRNKISSQAK